MNEIQAIYACNEDIQYRCQTVRFIYIWQKVKMFYLFFCGRFEHVLL